MERIPERDLMLGEEQCAAYASADWSRLHGQIPDHFQRHFPSFSEGNILDLGCGPADVTVRFLRAFPQTTALAVDGSDQMLHFAAQRIRLSGMESRVTIEKHYLPSARLETADFDAVISNSLLHHFADPHMLWQTVLRCGKRGAPVMVSDLIRPVDPEAALALVNEHAVSAPQVLQSDFAASLMAAYTLEEVKRQFEVLGVNLRLDRIDDFHFVATGMCP